MFDEIKRLLDKGDGKAAWHRLGELLFKGKGGVTTQDSGDNSPPPKKPGGG